MTRFLRVMGTIALLLAVPRLAEAGPITYTIVNYPADENGATLSGSITTDGTFGDLAKADITSWTFTITPSGGMAETASSSDAKSNVGITGDVVASQSSITLAGPTMLSSDNILQLVVQGNGTSGGYKLSYHRNLNAEDFASGTFQGIANTQNIWLTGSPSMGGTDPWVIATAVPEPSSLILAALGALGVIGCRLPRKRMPVRAASADVGEAEVMTL